MEFFALESEYLANGNIPIQQYRSTKPGSQLTAYFVVIDSQVINGYFCFGIDHPEATGLESLLWHLDSSGGLLPKTMRGDMLKPAWQFHGAENPLSDRDQSCYICTALGDKTFLGAFSCAVLMLENMEHVFHAHGIERKEDEEVGPPVPQGHGDVDTEQKILPDDVYCLSEAGEGAMAWEGTLQLMFPGVKCFQNRLLNTTELGEVTPQMLKCFHKYYRPDNLSVIITGKLEDKANILCTLASYEHEYYATHPVTLFTRPWASDIPKIVYDRENASSAAQFFPRNPNREPTSTVCFGWRGSKSVDIETTMALKVMTAHLAVGPFWTRFVASGLVQRIAWCQLEYVDCCSLITMHGVAGDVVCEQIRKEIDNILTNLGDTSKDQLKLEELQAMAERVGWHYVRELETDPFLMLASTISKGERYARGENEQMTKRLNPLQGYQELRKKPIDFWRNLIRTYFIDAGAYTTKVLPCSDERPPLPHSVEESPVQAEVAEAQPFISSSRRASSRPRRASSAVGEESNIAALNTNTPAPSPSAMDKTPPVPVKEEKSGHIERLLTESAFPFGDRVVELQEFTERLKHIGDYIDFAAESEVRFFPVETHRSDEAKQHPLFPVDDMPFFTFLEDIQSSFVYATIVMDTSHLDKSMRKFIAPITAALGAVLCPRPPGLDTDSEITEPNQFNPPQHISDSQVSLGVNGEMIQNIFLMMVVLPENYDWAVGMFHHLLYKSEFTVNFLKFVCTEAVKGLAANYRLQTADIPNYDCFDATEINLHSLVNMVYKQDSNSRLFVGRRRLDAMNEFLAKLDKDPAGTVKLVAEAWKKIVDEGRVVLQLGGNIKLLSGDSNKDLTAPWKNYFQGIQKSLKFSESKPVIESELMLTPGCEGIAVTVNHKRAPCFTTSVPINPSSEDFPKLCIASQLFSMAQKWVWACFGEEDFGMMPVLRMPCSYSHILTLNLESQDVLGFFEVMKKIMTEDWEWIDPLLIATKQMVINDPALMDNSPQGTVIISLMSHLSEIPLLSRRTLLKESLKVTKEDVKYVIRTYFQKLFDPKQCWYALMSHESDQELIINRLQESGFIFAKRNLLEVCTLL